MLSSCGRPMRARVSPFAFNNTRMVQLLHDLPRRGARRDPHAPALTYLDRTISYEDLVDSVERVASGLIDLDVARGERIAFFLEKRLETVATAFGAASAGAVFVPIN